MIKLLFPYPAVLIKNKKASTIVIADLHIGWEMALLDKGIHVPTQTPKLLNKLTALVSEYKPDAILILGDVKHTIATAEMREWQDVSNFFIELGKQVKTIQVIRGNHDGNLEPLMPESVTVLPATGVTMGEVGFFHGHQWPSPSLLECKTIIMGHVHPVVAFRDPSGFRIIKQVWIKADVNKTLLAEALSKRHKGKREAASKDTAQKTRETRATVQQLFIVPSFNDFLGGRPLNETRTYGHVRTEMVAGPVLRSEAVDMKNAEAYMLDGTFLGTMNQLKTLAS